MPQTVGQSLTGRLFSDHPRSLGMSWLKHGLGAMRIAGTMIGAGMACAVHAIVPGWFTETAGRTVMKLHVNAQPEAGRPPRQWPDYEIAAGPTSRSLWRFFGHSSPPNSPARGFSAVRRCRGEGRGG